MLSRNFQWAIKTNDTNVEAKWLEDSRHLLSIRDDLDNKAILQIVLMPKENYKGNKPFKNLDQKCDLVVIKPPIML